MARCKVQTGCGLLRILLARPSASKRRLCRRRAWREDRSKDPHCRTPREGAPFDESMSGSHTRVFAAMSSHTGVAVIKRKRKEGRKEARKEHRERKKKKEEEGKTGVVPRVRAWKGLGVCPCLFVCLFRFVCLFACVCVCLPEREREREGERQTDTDRDRQTDAESESDRQTETVRVRDRQTDRETQCFIIQG